MPRYEAELAEWRPLAAETLAEQVGRASVAAQIAYAKLGVELKPEARRLYINLGYAPKPYKEACGVAHWYRSTILQWPDQRPGEGAGAGRPQGSGKPLDPSGKRIVRKGGRKERIRRMLEDSDGQVTAKQIAEAEGITERQVHGFSASLAPKPSDRSWGQRLAARLYRVLNSYAPPPPKTVSYMTVGR
ncbi:hypothetical protein OHT93_36910 [Streptomyces sp. NBC_00191]|uniref:hypothetical protein n=1 Tax=Streptomyces sp. NBC_00191 TaxID=2975674 RepID=UPI00324470B3